MTAEQIASVQAYLIKRLGTKNISLRPRKVADSVEVYLNDEILGLLYIDDEDKDDISYDLNISILQQDLDET
ncbi:MAG: hypothetical protein COA69_14350 [Robiginitomaculum sp.]|nr:MAG: hypothetical protein COA69_14350 [Robiginitomaculum sp.]